MGDIAEIKFHLVAHERGYLIAKPLRDTHYDFLIDTGKRILRVQIKSTGYMARGAYRLDVRRSGSFGKTKRAYEDDTIDFIVGYIHPMDAWYIVPFEETNGGNLALYPHRPDSKGILEKYLGAWNLLE